MPRVHVYLPDDLYQFVKEHQLSASELLQEAIRSGVYQQDLREEMEHRINESIGGDSRAFCRGVGASASSLKPHPR